MFQRIKVLQCIRQGLIGGGESHLLSLMENIDQERFEPIVLSFTQGPMVDRLKEMNIKTHVITTHRPFDITKWNAVKKFMQQHRVELLHAHGTRALSNTFWAAKYLRLPIIYTVHGWSFHQDQPFFVRKIRIVGEEYLTSKADVNISVSVSNQQSGKKHIRSFRSEVIPNGINLSRFNPERNFADAREELCIPKEKLIILFIARFTTQKQPLALIQSFSNALQSNKKLHLLMVGEGDQKNDAHKLVDKLGISKSVTFCPFRSDVPELLAIADVFVLPSLWEGLPIALIEAMALGKAVIATNVDGTIEVIDNGINGVLVNSRNLVPELTNALVDLCNDSYKRVRLGTMAKKTVTENYNASTMARSIEKVYRNVMKRKVLKIRKVVSFETSLD